METNNDRNCWVSLHSTQPCILRGVVDRPNRGHQRPSRSMSHYNNLQDRTRTVARVKAIDLKV
ncbi:MAG: hypothetical protein HC764_26535 [Pleurocapsa sp. CRU_1_2]|nr:hypothetical protein [Pleurocapsa sp. CRU_1_2]